MTGENRSCCFSAASCCARWNRKVQLRRERARARIAIEPLEERVLHRLLQHEIRGEARADATRETRLADADRAFDHDESMRRRSGGLRSAFGGCGHAGEESLRSRIVRKRLKRQESSGQRPSGAIAPWSADDSAEPGNIEVGSDVGERIQNPVPLHYPGMRQRQHRIGALRSAEHQQIQIDDARTPALDISRGDPARARCRVWLRAAPAVRAA